LTCPTTPAGHCRRWAGSSPASTPAAQGTQVAFAAGSVWFVGAGVGKTTWRAAVIRNDDKVPGTDWQPRRVPVPLLHDAARRAKPRMPAGRTRRRSP
jgi:hypothetical protein